jgi:hypothetical protein
MSCAELERLFLAGSPEEVARSHRTSCRSCAALATDMDAVAATISTLAAPEAHPAFLAKLHAIPALTVSCEGADLLIAASVEEEIAAPDRQRLAFHTSRCESCAEAAGVLGEARSLASPAPAPWLLGRLAASRPEMPRRSPWRLLASPKGAIALAYAAAVAVMLSGFNPADLARKAGVDRLEQSAKLSAQIAGRSLGDRLGAFEEEALRKLAVWKGRATGYGRAALTRAIQLVMKTESQPPPRRGKTGEEKGLLKKDETQIQTWRA